MTRGKVPIASRRRTVIPTIEYSADTEKHGLLHTAHTSMGVIYKITSPSGKAYIGQTKQKLSSRLAAHVNPGDRKCPILGKAISKYGWRAMKIETLVEVPNSLLLEYEKKFIDMYQTFGRLGYNASPGGEDSPMKTPSIAAKSRATQMQPERQAKKVETFKKTRADPDVAKKYSDGLKRAHADPEVHAKFKRGWKAAQSKPEQRAKNSAAQLIAQKREEVNERRSKSLVEAWRKKNPDATDEQLAQMEKRRAQAAKRRATKKQESANLSNGTTTSDTCNDDWVPSDYEDDYMWGGGLAPGQGRSTPAPEHVVGCSV
ncbi:MAG: hypothetical protein CMM02_05195 [Rhodopirellula sp.]|nr:hypothetical protein [Rhodopirellula sp.]